MKTMSEDSKRQIRDLMRQKISLEDQLQIASDSKKIQRLEDDLYEVRHTLDILTNGVWFEDMPDHVLQAEKSIKH